MKHDYVTALPSNNINKMEDIEVKPILSKESLLSTLWSDGVLLNATVVAPSPSKDFCQLLISDDETVINTVDCVDVI